MSRIVSIRCTAAIAKMIGAIPFMRSAYVPHTCFAVLTTDDNRCWLWSVDDVLLEEWSR